MIALSLFLWSSLVVLCADAAVATATAKTATSTCQNVGVQLRLQRHPQMPVEALSEITTGASCAKSSMLAEILRSARQPLLSQHIELALLDCVATHMDEDLVGMYIVASACQANATADTNAWHAALRPQLQQLFRHVDPAAAGPALRYRSTVVQSSSLQLSTAYEALSQARAPRFKFKSAAFWAMPSDSGSTLHLELKVKNDGKTPLHVFAVTVKAPEDASLLGERVLLLTAENVATVDPSDDATLSFRAQSSHDVQLPDDTRLTLYFAHSAPRPHVLEAKLDGRKLKPFDATKAAKKPTGLLDESVSLSRGSYSTSSIDGGVWRGR
ncbi:hypothetical protein PINS_up002514 [Pythium insidiosum]|nr:hypothetical protein PINS_up002514 [Pythium insidiosum]